MVAREQQPAFGLVQDDVRGRVAGGLVHLPVAEVGLHLHARQQLSVGHHDLGDPELLAAARLLVRGERLGRHAGLARDLEAPLEGALRVLGRLGHVLVVRMHPELGPGALHDGRGLAVVVRVSVRADHEAHVLRSQAGLVERELELSHRAGLVEACVH
jgi:hypothetical protein